jgi:glycosyltransferase involved in cell wall biosynthesis
MPAVSVVIPAYNRAGTIRLAIESVLRQTFADLEVLVVDDASADGTKAAAEAIADPRVRVLAHETNRGASAARNTGVREARAPWVAFQDSDDEWLPLKLEKQMARLDAGTFVAAYCGMIVIGRSGDSGRGRPTVAYVPRPDIALVEGDILPSLMRTSIVSTQTLVARRDDLLAVGGFDESFRALIDWELMLRLAPRGPVACVDEPLVLQRFSPNSITHEAALRAEARTRAISKHLALLSRHPDLLARLHYVAAGEHRRLGDLAAARTALARARVLRPADPRLWAMTGYVALRRLAP